MKKALLLLSVLALFASACNKPAGDDPAGDSIIGEWSMMAGPDDVRMHISIKTDGSYVLTMPAWDEQRFGTYVIKGDIMTLTCNKLAWVIGRDNGYRNVYDQYCDVPMDEVPDFSHFAQQRPEEVVMDVKFYLEAGALHLDGIFGMPAEESWFPHADFDAVAECRKHTIFF